jgi:uncharacterized protein YneF (UPF0154 family)
MTRFVFLAGTVVSGLMLTTAVYAQQPTQQPNPQQQQTQQQQDQSGQQLSNREVRQFMQRVERDVNQIMQSGNLDRLRQWTQATIADGAVFTGTREFNADGQRKVFVNATLTKQDIMRLARLAMGTMSEFSDLQQDFNFNIQVLNVQPIGDSAALVKTRVTESQTIGGPRTTGARVGQDQSTQGAGDRDADDQVSRRQRGQQFGQRGQQQGAQLETQAMCTHLLKRSEDGSRIQVAMQTCDAETQLQR